MNIFIGGYFDGKKMPFDEFEGNVFYAANLGDGEKTPYYRATKEKKGKTYTFWILDGLDENLTAKKIDSYLVNI